MTDQPEGAGQPVPGNDQGVPAPKVGNQGSAGAGSDAGSGQSAADVVDARLSAFKEELPQIIQGQIDSTKDKRFHQQSKLAADVERINAYIEEAKGDTKQALRNMAVDDLIAEGRLTAAEGAQQRGPGDGSSVSPAAAISENVEDVVTRVLSEEGIPSNHPRLREWAQNEFPTMEAMELSLRREAAKIKKADNVSPGAVALEGGGTPRANPDLRAQYEAELAELKGSRNVDALIALRKKYQAQGLDV